MQQLITYHDVDKTLQQKIKQKRFAHQKQILHSAQKLM